MAKVLLKEAALIDGTGAGRQENVSVLIDGNKIAAIEKDIPSEQLKGVAEIVHLEGRTILPGLINAHDHLTFKRIPGTEEEILTKPDVLQVLYGVKNSFVSLREGVTSVSDAGAANGTNIAVKRGLDLGLFLGPRLITCGQPLAMTGGHSFLMDKEADGADELRKEARRQIKNGADFIKVIATGGVGALEGEEPSQCQLTVEEMKAAIEVAHRAGKKTEAHANAKGIMNAIEAGVDCITHGNFLDQKAAELMAERGIFLIPTLSVYKRLSDKRSLMGRSERWMKLAQEVLSFHIKEDVGKAIEAGVRIATGTDSMGELVEEMELLVEAGYTRMQAILAATKVGAEVLQMESKVGTIEIGKLADMIAVDGDPLSDLSVLRKIHMVMKDGVVLHPESLFARPYSLPYWEN